MVISGHIGIIILILVRHHVCDHIYAIQCVRTFIISYPFCTYLIFSPIYLCTYLSTFKIPSSSLLLYLSLFQTLYILNLLHLLSFSVSLSDSNSLSLSISFCLSLFLSLSHTHTLFLSILLTFSLSPLYLPLLSLSHFSLTLTFSFSLSLSISLPSSPSFLLFISLSVSLTFSFSLSIFRGLQESFLHMWCRALAEIDS